MVIVFALMIAVAGGVGVGVVSLVGYVLALWLGRWAAGAFAAALVAAIVWDARVVASVLRETGGGPDARAVARIFAAAYAAPLLVALPCAGYFVWTALRG